jgi:hypothetical protein
MARQRIAKGVPFTHDKKTKQERVKPLIYAKKTKASSTRKSSSPHAHRHAY